MGTIANDPFQDIKTQESYTDHSEHQIGFQHLSYDLPETSEELSIPGLTDHTYKTYIFLEVIRQPHWVL